MLRDCDATDHRHRGEGHLAPFFGVGRMAHFCYAPNKTKTAAAAQQLL
jgi:hypothetical protein